MNPGNCWGIGDGREWQQLNAGCHGRTVGNWSLVAWNVIFPEHIKKILQAKDTSTMVTGRATGHPVR